MKVWRIVKAEHAATAYSGVGSDRGTGRWHTPPRRIIYAAATPELAILEKLTRLRRLERLEGHVLVAADIGDGDIEVIDNHPVPYDLVPATAATQQHGDAWLDEVRSLAKIVPSALVPSQNILINPAHPRISTLEIGTAQPVARALVTERAITS